MTLAWLSLLLAFATLTTRAMAGDNRTSSPTASSSADAGPQSAAPRPGGAESVPPNSDVAPQSQLLFPGAGSYDFVLAPDAQDRGPLARFRARSALNLADVNGDVCYTMRTYKMKPTERIRDRENLFRGYSECEMASNYQIRSAEAHQKKPHSDEPPATLK